MINKDGGPAFPVPNSVMSVPGMSLRDWFAGMALQGVVSGVESRTTEWKGKQLEPKDVAFYAYTLADAMLAEREKK